MQLEAERADALDQRQLDEVMDVLCRRVIAHKGLARFGCVVGGNRIERGADLRCFTFGEDLCGTERRRVRFAGGYFVGKKPPIKDYGTLPLFELRIERFSKAAGPHFHFTASFSLALLNLGISLPLLRVRRPAAA